MGPVPLIWNPDSPVLKLLYQPFTKQLPVALAFTNSASARIQAFQRIPAAGVLRYVNVYVNILICINLNMNISRNRNNNYGQEPIHI